MIEEEIEEDLADHIKESHTIEELYLVIDTLSEKYICKIESYNIKLPKYSI